MGFHELYCRLQMRKLWGNLGQLLTPCTLNKQTETSTVPFGLIKHTFINLIEKKNLGNLKPAIVQCFGYRIWIIILKDVGSNPTTAELLLLGV